MDILVLSFFLTMAAGTSIICYHYLKKAWREFRDSFYIIRHDGISGTNSYGESAYAGVEGKVEPIDGSSTVTAPLTKTECLAFTYSVEIEGGSENSNDGSVSEANDVYVTVEEGEELTAFLLVDGANRFRVSPDGATLAFETERYVNYPWRELPESIQSYIESSPLIEPQETIINSIVTYILGDHQLFREGRLERGGDVYVRGTIQPSPSDAFDGIIHAGPNPEEFVIYNISRRQALWNAAKRGMVALIPGLLTLLIIGLALFASVSLII